MKKSIVFGSLLFLIMALCWGLFKVLTYLDHEKKDYDIVLVAQTGPQKGALKTDYLCELLDLSADRPTKAKDFDLKKAKNKLLSSPVIRDAEVLFLPPRGIYIDYTIRKPIAKVDDFENVAIDLDGYLFPLYPFFSPKNLPELHLGLTEWRGWDIPIKSKNLEVAFNVLNILSEATYRDFIKAKRLDCSDVFADSLGFREIRLIIEDKKLRIVAMRLNSENFRENLKKYLALRDLDSGFLFLESDKVCNENGKVSSKRIAESAILGGKDGQSADYERIRFKTQVGDKMTVNLIDFRLDGLAFIQSELVNEK